MVSMLETEYPDACLVVRSCGHTQVSAHTVGQYAPDPVERFFDENRFRKDCGIDWSGLDRDSHCIKGCCPVEPLECCTYMCRRP
jgi:hypothetical protein